MFILFLLIKIGWLLHSTLLPFFSYNRNFRLRLVYCLSFHICCQNLMVVFKFLVITVGFAAFRLLSSFWLEGFVEGESRSVLVLKMRVGDVKSWVLGAKEVTQMTEDTLREDICIFIVFV